MDITASSIATWVLSELYYEEVPKSKKYLARNLCEASFASMAEDDDFEKIMTDMEKAEYIEYATRENIDYKQVPVAKPASLFSQITPEYKIEEVKVKHSGYLITTKGIMTFRKQIITPIDKTVPHLELVQALSDSEFGKMITEITTSKGKSIPKYVISQCNDNAPLLLEFLKYCINELSKQNISLS